MDLGSFQLFLDVPSGMRVSEVILASTGERIIFHQNGNELNMGWFAKNGFVRLTKGDELLVIRRQSDFPGSDVQVGIRGLSMAYDGEAIRYDMARISVPRFVSTMPELQVYCYPNPFSSSTQIIYELPESGKVSLYLSDYTGKVVRNQVADHTSSGRFVHEVDGNGLPDGVYMVQVVFESISGNINRRNHKVVLRR